MRTDTPHFGVRTITPSDATERVQTMYKFWSWYVFIVKDTFAERNKTICNKMLNKCLADVYFFLFCYSND